MAKIALTENVEPGESKKAAIRDSEAGKVLHGYP